VFRWRAALNATPVVRVRRCGVVPDRSDLAGGPNCASCATLPSAAATTTPVGRAERPA